MKRKNNVAAMAILMLNMFISQLGFGLIIPVLPAYMQSLGASGLALGGLVSAMGITQFLFSPTAGQFSDRYGRKAAIVLGLTVFAIAQGIFCIAHTVTWLFVSRLINGIGISLVNPAVTAYVADITSEAERPGGMGKLSAAMLLGIVIGPGIGGLLADYGLRIPFYAAGGAAILAMVASLVLLRVREHKRSKAVEVRETKTAAGMVTLMVNSFKAPYFSLLFFVYVLTFGLAIVEAIFGLYVNVKYGFTPKDISLLITGGALAGVVVQYAIIDKLLQRFGEISLIRRCLLSASLFLLLMVFSGYFWQMFVVNLFFFSSIATLRPAIHSRLSKLAGQQQGLVFGLNDAYTSLGLITGPILAGILFDIQIDLPLLCGVVIILCGLFLSNTLYLETES